MINSATDRLEYLLQTIPGLLLALPEDVFSAKPGSAGWSRKEILGHLIDSAANNHQRFIRGQFEHQPQIGYDPDQWVRHGYYQDIASSQLVVFWTAYNRQLLEIIRRIPAAYMDRQLRTGDMLHSLEFLIVDYVQHLEHHLRQLVDYA